ncbi:hypothetical protein M408DRAFT_333631 [Serendipita vermifera MAFF 305830]|uniref:SH3 domain-containing protein n=1 Tax=Serendipita vermifera MAFF 305830 TaxID=933852 RepID=A0A0C3AMD5_SERVB|nr:hypothetical protein M408DRAFT_333631 [Serendipita vermifera MAFF 305830]
MVSEDGSIAGDVPEVAASKRASRRLSAFTALSALESATEGEVVHFGRSSAGGSVKGESKEDPTPAAQEEEADDTGTAAKPILVQDFGFPEDDVRFSKRPWYLLTQAERSALGEDSRPKEEEEESDEDDEYEHGAGGWSTAWLKHGRAIEDGDDGEDMTPRFGHGFSDEGDANATQGGGENGGNGGGGEIDPDSPLPPGIYRALYAFEAEGTAEMSLAEGQLVRVVGRGGGVGWAVVEREWTPGGSGEEQSERPPPAQVDDAAEGSGSGALGLAGQALVPEGYLEIWRLDDEEW